MENGRHSLAARARKRGLLIVAAFVVLLGLAEGALRLIATLAGDVRGTEFDPELGWRLVPGITKADPLWSDKLPVTINSLGWRDAEFPVEKTAGRTRILALGDSFTFGTGVDYGRRFSEVLERDVETVDVLNLGVFAYGPEQEVRVYEIHGVPLKPDIVLLNLYLGNDLDDIRIHALHGVPKPYFELTGEALHLVRPEQTAWAWTRSNSRLAEGISRLLEWRPSNGPASPTRNGARESYVLLALVRRLAIEIQKNGAEFLTVIIHPRRAAPVERSYLETVSAAVKRTGVAVFDLRHILPVEEEPSADEVYLSDGHWSATGHALFAGALERELTARGWLARP